MELIFCCIKERNDLMINIIKEEIEVEEALRKKKMIMNFNHLINYLDIVFSSSLNSYSDITDVKASLICLSLEI